MDLRSRSLHDAGTRSVDSTPGPRDLESLLEALKKHDPYTAGHSRRVSSYGALVARLLGLSERQIEIVRRAGLAHDVGKLAVPRDLLAKNVGLTREEFERIRTHSVAGGSLVERIEDGAELAPIVTHHHEHWDGNGYPHGLMGSDIPLEARIILVVDAFDAMTTARPYDPRISSGAALKEIVHCSGQQFDPLAVEAIKHAWDEGLLQQTELAPAVLF
jgi:HD-GYP domain-containing protein (c-di-GMP phosphodiesterase class II)